jgi:hypothetical protein
VKDWKKINNTEIIQNIGDLCIGYFQKGIPLFSLCFEVISHNMKLSFYKKLKFFGKFMWVTESNRIRRAVHVEFTGS